MAATLTCNDLKGIKTAIEDVKNEESLTNWALLSYDGTHSVKFVEKGDGGAARLSSELQNHIQNFIFTTHCLAQCVKKSFPPHKYQSYLSLFTPIFRKGDDALKSGTTCGNFQIPSPFLPSTPLLPLFHW
jgi:hypothetical protein